MRRLIAILGLVCVYGSMATAEDAPVPLPRPRPQPHRPAWAEPHSFREAAGPNFNSAEVTSEPSGCRLRLEKIAAIVAMPRLIGPGACGGGDMVQLDAVLLSGGDRVMLKPAPVLRCEMAESLAAWIHDDAAPQVAKIGTALQSIETYDDFECRGRNRVFGAVLSEHGKGNAIDLRALVLADRRVIRLTDVTASKELRAALRESACHRFTTVLGPGDRNHEDHIHVDLAARRNGYRICQWQVREPPKPEPAKPQPDIAGAQIAGKNVPLPTPRPAILNRI